MLQVLSYELLECQSADTVEQGLDLLRSQHFDCVVLALTEHSATSLMQSVKEATPDMPCIGLCLSPTGGPDKKACAEAGLDYLVTFPLKREKLLEAVFRASCPYPADCPAKQIIRNPGIEFDLQLQNFDGDWDFVVELLDMWVEDSRCKMSNLLAAAETWDLQTVSPSPWAAKLKCPRCDSQAGISTCVHRACKDARANELSACLPYRAVDVHRPLNEGM